MNNGPSVIVKKSGFLAAVAKGIFGTIITVVLCATALGLYGIRMCDHNMDMIRQVVTKIVPEVLDNVPDIIAAMPPLIADALNDRRAPEYRPEITIETRMAHRNGRQVAVLELHNDGDQTVSLLTLHVAFENNEGVPVWSDVLLAASPIGCDEEVPGLLMPGATRKLTCGWLHHHGDVEAVTADITDLRVWNGSEVESASESVHEPALPAVDGEDSAA